MSSPNLIESWSITNYSVTIKFDATIKVSTITNDRFALYQNDATPFLVDSDPFKDISHTTDYNSISKTLTLYWNDDVLEAETAYQLKLSGFRTASNILIEDETLDFATGTAATPSFDDLTQPEELEIIDYTIIPDAFVSTNSVGDLETEETTTSFALVETDPLDEDAFLSEDYNNGVLILKFNIRPKEAFINDTYFRGERKLLQRKPSKWEKVAVEVERDDYRPWVYVKFPSNDTTPVYDTEDRVYWEGNYIYRVRILKEVGG